MKLLLPFIILFSVSAALALTFSQLNSYASNKNIIAAAHEKPSDNNRPDFVKISATESVTLLEQILQKMHTMPQIAQRNKNSVIALKKEDLAERDKDAGSASSLNAKLASARKAQIELKSVESMKNVKLRAAAKRAPEISWVPNVPRFYSAPNSYPLSSTTPSPRDSRMRFENRSSNMPSSPALIEPKQATDSFSQTQARKPAQSAGQLNRLYGAPVDPRYGQSNEVGESLSPPASGFLSHKTMQVRGNPAPLQPMKQKNDSLDIALLPPTLIRGIPLLSLGDSQQKILKAVAEQKNLVVKQEPVHGWLVYSVYKNRSPESSVQVFLRQGMVEAIRVFDSSFLRPDFDIRLGDDLFKVKEKFGEPAFILAEKRIKLTQNYIYPLNQVGFQFSRPISNESPKLESMLIFNVQ